MNKRKKNGLVISWWFLMKDTVLNWSAELMEYSKDVDS